MPVDRGQHLTPLPEAESLQLWPTAAAMAGAQCRVPTTPSLWQAKPFVQEKLSAAILAVLPSQPSHPAALSAVLRHLFQGAETARFGEAE